MFKSIYKSKDRKEISIFKKAEISYYPNMDRISDLSAVRLKTNSR